MPLSIDDTSGLKEILKFMRRHNMPYLVIGPIWQEQVLKVSPDLKSNYEKLDNILLPSNQFYKKKKVKNNFCTSFLSFTSYNRKHFRKHTI